MCRTPPTRAGPAVILPGGGPMPMDACFGWDPLLVPPLAIAAVGREGVETSFAAAPAAAAEEGMGLVMAA